MEPMIAMFVITLAVAIGNILARLVPAISNTYINLLMGILIALIPFTNDLISKFNNEFFMIVILAPLLFFEGQNTPVVMVRKKIPNIIGTAGVLAIFSAVVSSILLHSILGLALPMALIIISICTPTDATALESVISGREFPESTQETLKMESLFNDATGIILLQAGLIWLQSGHLNLIQNIGALLLSSIGGLIVGNILAGFFTIFRQWLIRSSLNDIFSQNMIYLLSPFIIYIIGELLHVSGIIAVVVAGLVNNSEANRSRFVAPRQMNLGVQMVNFFNEMLNGFVFVTLGLNLERIFTEHYNQYIQTKNWLIIGTISYTGLLICRWIYARLFIGDHSNRTASLFALGGVHGTVTLAMTFSLLGNNLNSHIFNLIILVETVVIVLSMLVPTLIFHWWLPIDNTEKYANKTLNELRHDVSMVGIKKINSMELSKAVHDSAIYDLQDQTRNKSLKSFISQWTMITSDSNVLTTLQSKEQQKALMSAFQAEREYLLGLEKQNKMDSKIIFGQYNEILLAESLLVDTESPLV